MKVEVPEIKRCCFCIPLRYGLIAWGYLKLALSLFLLTACIIRLAIEENLQFMDKLFISCFMIVLFLDISITLVFLVGSHQKTAQLLQVFYIYSIVQLCIYGVLYACSTGSDIYFASRFIEYGTEGHFIMVFVIQSSIFMGFSSFGIQMYIILLIRSEINKLRSSSSFRFTNLVSEGEVENGTKQLRISN